MFIMRDCCLTTKLTILLYIIVLFYWHYTMYWKTLNWIIFIFVHWNNSLHVKYVAPLQTKKFYHWFLNCAFLVNQYVPNSQRIWSSFAQKILYYNQRLSRACIVHLVINRNNWSYVKTMSCSGSHLGIPINIKNTKCVKDLPWLMQFRFNQCNSFREENISVFSHMVQC